LKFLAVVRFVSRRGQVMAAAAVQQPRHCSCFSSLFLAENSLCSAAASKSQLEQEVIRTNSSYGWQRQVGFSTCHRQLFCSAKIELFAG
jgi:hypothetical protein